VGTGESTVLGAFAHSLDRNVWRVVDLSDPHLTVTSLFRQILLGPQTEPASSFRRLLPQSHAIVSDLARKWRYTHFASDSSSSSNKLIPSRRAPQSSRCASKLRFLVNPAMDSASTITLVPIGQPALGHKLRLAWIQHFAKSYCSEGLIRPYEAQKARYASRFRRWDCRFQAVLSIRERPRQLKSTKCRKPA